MELLPDIGSLILSLTPPLSLVLNIILLFALLYLIRKSPQSPEIKTADQKIASVYKEAEFEASELMKDASDKAKRIVQEAGLTKDSLDSRLEKSLDQMTAVLNEKIVAGEEEIFKQFKKVFEKISESYQNEGTTIVNGFKEEGDTMLKTFIQTMHAEINSVRGQVFEKIDSKMALIEEDLKEYRESQQKRLDESMQKVAKNTIELYMKEALSDSDHEQVLFKALNRFKKETPNTN